MEMTEGAAARSGGGGGGGCCSSIRDLPPSKRFKFVGSHLGSNPCMPLPAKKRAFPPLPAEDRVVPPMPGPSPVSACLPAKKRAYAPAVAEGDAVKACLPVKKRMYAPAPDAVVPACFPAKRCVHPLEDAAAPPSIPAKKRIQPPQPPEDAAAPPSIPAKKRVQPPQPPEDAAAPLSIPAKKRVQPPQPPEDAAAPPSIPAKKRVQPPQPPEDAAAPLSIPAKKRVQPQQPPEDAAAPPSIPAKKHVQPPQPPEDAAAPSSIPAKKRVHPPPPPELAAASLSISAKQRVHPEVEVAAASRSATKRAQAPSRPEGAPALVSVCLPANKRVMPPFIPPSLSPPMKSDGPRVAAVKETRPQGSNKRGGATDPRAANGVRDHTRAEASKKTEKPIEPTEIKEEVSMKSRSANTTRESKDLQCKKSSNAVVNGKRSEAQVEVLKKFGEASDSKVAAPAREDVSIKEDEDVAPEREHDAVEEEDDDDDGVLCAVCRSTDGDPSDPIVFCDGCDLMVHASCYGKPLAQSIPDGDWFCSLCSDKAAQAAKSATAKKGRPPSRPCCRLCPARGGAMKRTTDGAWAHIACALLVPEVFFRDPDGRDGVDCSRVPGHRFTKECYVCESSRGCALECSQPKCGLGFHVSCGLAGGLCIEYREAKGGAVVAGFCWEHTKLWEKQQLTGKYKIVSRGN